MALFKPKETLPDQSGAIAGRAQFTMGILRSAVMLLVLAVAVAAYLTNAWFVNNREVASEDSTISAASETASLFIKKSSDTSTTPAYNMKETNTVTKTDLYPISTSDGTNWYYAIGWDKDATGTPANKFQQVTKGDTAAVGTAKEENYIATYLNAVETDSTGAATSKTAYYYSDYVLYTNAGEMDVYLNPENPITVTCKQGDTETNGKLNEAIRVGILAGDKFIIYAPANESSFSAVTSATETSAATVLTDTNLSDSKWLADKVTVSGTEVTSYKAKDGGTPLGTANTTGLTVRVLVWVEGTDSDVTTGAANNWTSDKVTVKVSYVGVPKAASSDSGSGGSGD